jgi:predicted acyltransferase
LGAIVAQGGRLQALDMLRGLAVAGMIIVVSPGDWGQRYAQLDHANWNGATVADMVFPAFLFSVGMALGLSFPRTLATASERRLFWSRLLRRTILLIFLGIVVEASFVIAQSVMGPFSDGGGWLQHTRIPGILQRIGLCYGFAGALVYVTATRDAEGIARIDPRKILGSALIILVGYWVLLELVPVPGFGAGQLTPAGSLPGFIDRTVFTEPHLWPLGSATGSRPATYDPEGLLSTLPAMTNVLFGVLAAWAWKRNPGTATTTIAVAGVLLIGGGLALDPFFVINKRIWTSSFALLGSGVSALAFAGLALALRSRFVDSVLIPLRVLGANAILAFLLSTLMSRFSGFPIMPEGGQRLTPQTWAYHRALAVLPEPHLASLLCALSVLALVTLLIWPLHQRAIHFRI